MSFAQTGVGKSKTMAETEKIQPSNELGLFINQLSSPQDRDAILRSMAIQVQECGASLAAVCVEMLWLLEEQLLSQCQARKLAKITAVVATTQISVCALM